MSYHPTVHSVTHCAVTLNAKADNGDEGHRGYPGFARGRVISRRGLSSLLSR